MWNVRHNSVGAGLCSAHNAQTYLINEMFGVGNGSKPFREMFTKLRGITTTKKSK